MKHDLVYPIFKKYELEHPVNDKKYFKEYGESYNHLFRFPNNYGASVVKHFGSYGYELDLFELAVVYFEDPKSNDYILTYNTPITSDVIGYLTNNDVIRYLLKIKNL